MSKPTREDALRHLSLQCSLNPTSAEAFLAMLKRAHTDWEDAKLYDYVLKLDAAGVRGEIAKHGQGLGAIANRLGDQG